MTNILTIDNLLKTGESQTVEFKSGTSPSIIPDCAQIFIVNFNISRFERESVLEKRCPDNSDIDILLMPLHDDHLSLGRDSF